MELYEAHIDDTETGRDGIQLVLDYEGDRAATRFVKDWLVSMLQGLG